MEGAVLKGNKARSGTLGKKVKEGGSKLGEMGTRSEIKLKEC